MKKHIYGILFSVFLVLIAVLSIVAEGMKEPIDLKFEEIETSPDAININTATKEEIMELEGVGEALADKIIDYRKVKPFETVHDITLISGFGEKLFEDNKEMIKVK